VPYPAGGPTDVIARIVAADITGPLGQQVVVENMSGASGAIGTRVVAKSRPDGLTIVFGNNQTHGNNMFMLKDPGYDAIKDFAPLAGAGAFEHVFVVRKDLPAETIQDVIKLAKEKPGALNYGSTGIGSGSHLSTELFMARTGIKMTHVPYRGAGPALTDLIAGTTDVMFDNLPSSIEFVKSGKLRALGVTTDKRNAALPDVPTVADTVPGFEASAWFGIGAPKGTPPDVIAKLNKAVNAALADPKMQTRLADLGGIPMGGTPADFGKIMADETAKWEKAVKFSGASID